MIQLIIETLPFFGIVASIVMLYIFITKLNKILNDES